MALEFDDTQAAVLLELLGLAADTEDVQLILDTVRDAVRDPMLPPVDAQPSAIAAAAATCGLEVLDRDTLSGLRAAAAEGQRLAAAAARADVEAKVDKAIDRGALALSSRTTWVDLISADPGMAAVLAKVPDGAVVPFSEIGHSADRPDTGAEPVKWVW